MVVYYPLTIDKIDINLYYNAIAQTLGTTTENITYSTIYAAYTTPPYISTDSEAAINWSTAFNWNIANPGKYIQAMSGGGNLIYYI